MTRLLTADSLRRLAGARSYGLGEEYYTDGLVSGLAQDGDTLAAQVHGTQSYRVKLQASGERLKYDCSCPFAAEGAFCKHCVAVGLAWLSGAAPGGKTTAVTMDDVRAYLQKQGKEVLISLLVEQALEDADLQTRLFLRVAQAAAGGPNLFAYRRAIDRAAKTGDLVEYDDVPDYARGLERVAESLDELLSAGHAGAAVELTEHALAQVEKGLNSVDDSNGSVGGVLHDLERLHRDACILAKPEPVALARRLYEWQMRSGLVFSDVLDDYAEVLGVRGLAEYRRMAEADWASVPAHGPNQRRTSDYGSPWRLAQVMESLARRTGDVEAVVAILSRDLSDPYRFLAVAKEYLDAGNEPEASAWAERGLKEFPDTQDGRLVEFLVERYQTLGRHDEALALLWSRFRQRPALAHYQALREYAQPVGRWEEWRTQALAFLRGQIEAEKARPSRFGLYMRVDNSELVRILLWEGREEDAWREAQQGGCAEALWLELAGKREKEHPEDALEIYRARGRPAGGADHQRRLRRAGPSAAPHPAIDDAPGPTGRVRPRHRASTRGLQAQTELLEIAGREDANPERKLTPVCTASLTISCLFAPSCSWVPSYPSGPMPRLRLPPKPPSPRGNSMTPVKPTRIWSSRTRARSGRASA